MIRLPSNETQNCMKASVIETRVFVLPANRSEIPKTGWVRFRLCFDAKDNYDLTRTGYVLRLLDAYGIAHKHKGRLPSPFPWLRDRLPTDNEPDYEG